VQHKSSRIKRKPKSGKIGSVHHLLTTGVAVCRAHAVHNLLDTTEGMLTVRRSVGLEPRYIKLGRAIFYNMRDFDAWCKARIVERAQAAARKLAGRDE
jgi:hypothetical protein